MILLRGKEFLSMMALPRSPQNVGYRLLQSTDNHALFVSAYSIAFFSTALIAVSLRLLARKVGKVPSKQDDYLIVVALVCSPSNAILSWAGEP